GLYIMCGFLAFSVALMSLLYASAGSNDTISLLLEWLTGGDAKFDSFHILDGELQDKLGDLVPSDLLEDIVNMSNASGSGAGGSGGGVSQAVDPAFKMLMVGVDPYYLRELPRFLEELFGLQNDVLDDLQNGLSSVHTTFYNDYFRSYLAQDKLNLRILDGQVKFFRDNLDARKEDPTTEPVGFMDYAKGRLRLFAADPGTDALDEVDEDMLDVFGEPVPVWLGNFFYTQKTYEEFLSLAGQIKIVSDPGDPEPVYDTSEADAAYRKFFGAYMEMYELFLEVRQLLNAGVTYTNYALIPTGSLLNMRTEYSQLVYQLQRMPWGSTINAINNVWNEYERQLKRCVFTLEIVAGAEYALIRGRGFPELEARLEEVLTAPYPSGAFGLAERADELKELTDGLMDLLVGLGLGEAVGDFINLENYAKYTEVPVFRAFGDDGKMPQAVERQIDAFDQYYGIGKWPGTFDSGFFEGCNRTLREMAHKYIDPSYVTDTKYFKNATLTGAEKERARAFLVRYTTTGRADYDSWDEVEFDILRRHNELIDLSYNEPVTERIYNEYFYRYYVSTQAESLEETSERLDAALAKYSPVRLLLSLLPMAAAGAGEAFDLGAAGVDDELFAELLDFFVIPSGDLRATYEDIRDNFRSYDGRAQLLNTYAKNVCAKISIDGNNLRDRQVKELYGFIWSSKYSLNSSITRAEYMLSEGLLKSDYSTPEGVNKGYSFMTFAFILISIIILIMGIVLAAGMIAGEHSDGTMKLLLIRPHTRWQVLLSKYITVVLMLLTFYIVSFGLTFAIGWIGWGVSGAKMAISVVNGARVVILHPAVVLLLVYATAFLEAAIFALIALTISTIFKSRSGAIAISMLVFFVSYVLGQILATYPWYRYILFNNTNLFTYFSSAGPSLADMTLGFSLIVDAIYIAILGVACFFTFARRDAN
ncbi:MAG: ABC transporter permease, partial [Firmicutes bacterium]|nr:ABC transporter permease [Bacillota bacterium]